MRQISEEAHHDLLNSSSYPPEPSLLERFPDLIRPVNRYHDAAAYFIWGAEAEPGAISGATLLLHGWRSDADTLRYVGEEIVRRDPASVAVALQQPLVPLPQQSRLLPHYLKEISLSGIGRLRRDSVSVIGAAICESLGVEYLDVEAHSLAAIDGVRSLTDGPTEFEARRVDLLAPAGLLERGEAWHVALRAPSSRCGPKHPTPYALLPATGIQGLYALRTQIQPGLAALREADIDLVAVDFARDRMFMRRSIPIGFTEDTYVMLHGGCACHGYPKHPEAAPQIVDALEYLHDRVAA